MAISLRLGQRRADSLTEKLRAHGPMAAAELVGILKESAFHTDQVACGAAADFGPAGFAAALGGQFLGGWR
jgi:predicted naringenin-chalcone synthase